MYKQKTGFFLRFYRNTFVKNNRTFVASDDFETILNFKNLLFFSYFKKTIQCILQSFFKDEKTKMTNEAIHLSRELIGLFITEAIMRSCKEAEKDSTTTVSIEHLEKILPQLLLDF